ncbi:hypothetical protein D3C87_1250260 [compost metagenome]
MPTSDRLSSSDTSSSSALAMRVSTTLRFESRLGARISRSSSQEPNHIAASTVSRIQTTPISVLARLTSCLPPIEKRTACIHAITSDSTPSTYSAMPSQTTVVSTFSTSTSMPCNCPLPDNTRRRM